MFQLLFVVSFKFDLPNPALSIDPGINNPSGEALIAGVEYTNSEKFAKYPSI
jgi:hypothetical protein